MRKHTKYRLLRHLPGHRGRHYSRKLKYLIALDEFDDALQVSANKTCIDLGANVGEYTEMMARSVKSVIAFEPDPWAYAKLMINMERFTNVRLENAAASTMDGVVQLWRHAEFHSDPAKYSIGSSLISHKFDITNNDQVVEVRSINFIDYIADLDEDIGVIKMDVEGAEVDILEALLDTPEILSRVDYVFAETHENRIRDQTARVECLVERCFHMTKPYFNLNWR